MNITTIDNSRNVAKSATTTRQTLPAYVRGIPASVWQTALRHPGQRQRADAT